MEELKNEELLKVSGGFDINIAAITLVSLGVPFIVGFIDGLVRPLACN